MDNTITQFNSLSSELDSEIDETFFQWCLDTDTDYLSNEEDYPESFKTYFISNCIN
jgi:hypothetical protein